MTLFSSTKKPNPGKLVVITGSTAEAANKQQRLMLEALEFAGFSATLINFPVRTSLGSLGLEQFGSLPETTPQALAIFRALDRFEQKTHLEHLLNEGKVVITTDYTITNAALSGAGITEAHDRVSFFTWVHNLEHKIFRLPKPDLNIILRHPRQVETSKKKGHTEKQVDLYGEIAKFYPTTKIVSCAFQGLALTPKEIHNSVWQLVRRIVLRNVHYERN